MSTGTADAPAPTRAAPADTAPQAHKKQKKKEHSLLRQVEKPSLLAGRVDIGVRSNAG